MGLDLHISTKALRTRRFFFLLWPLTELSALVDMLQLQCCQWCSRSNSRKRKKEKGKRKTEKMQRMIDQYVKILKMMERYYSRTMTQDRQCISIKLPRVPRVPPHCGISTTWSAIDTRHLDYRSSIIDGFHSLAFFGSLYKYIVPFQAR